MFVAIIIRLVVTGRVRILAVVGVTIVGTLVPRIVEPRWGITAVGHEDQGQQRPHGHQVHMDIRFPGKLTHARTKPNVALRLENNSMWSRRSKHR